VRLYSSAESGNTNTVMLGARWLVTGELDPWRLNLHTKMRSGGNGMWGRGPAQSKQSFKKKKILKLQAHARQLFTNVSDTFSVLWIPDPDFFSSWIPDPTTPTLEQLPYRTAFEPTDKELNIPKYVTNLSEIRDGDPGSGKKLISDPDPGINKAPDPGSGSAALLFFQNL
jgi:hypothetical protein